MSNQQPTPHWLTRIGMTTGFFWSPMALRVLLSSVRNAAERPVGDSNSVGDTK